MNQITSIKRIMSILSNPKCKQKKIQILLVSKKYLIDHVINGKQGETSNEPSTKKIMILDT